MKGRFPFLPFYYINFIEGLYYIYFNKLFRFSNNFKNLFNKGERVAVYFNNNI